MSLSCFYFFIQKSSIFLNRVLINFIVLTFFLVFETIHAQNIAINIDGSTADPSSVFDIKTTTGGFLLPRLTDAERNAIPAPAIGLIVYNTSTNLFNVYTASGWYSLNATTYIGNNTGSTAPGQGIAFNSTGNSALPVAICEVSSSIKGLLIPRTTTGSISSPATGLMIYNTSLSGLSYYNSSTWKTPCSQLATTTTGGGSLAGSPSVGINATGANPDITAMLDVYSTTKGMLIPRMTDANRDALNPINGLILYNTTTNLLNYWNGIGWYSLAIDAPPQPGAITGIDTLCENSSGNVYSISAVPGATSYTWSVPAGSSITAGQGTTSITVTFGITSGNVSVTATNGCGTSSARNLAIKLTTNTLAAVTAQAATSVERTKFTANWTAGAGVTKDYYLDVSENSGVTSFVTGYNNRYVGKVTSVVVSGLTCNTTYYYRVRRTNGCVTSSNSNTISQLTVGCGCLDSLGVGTNDAFSIISTSDGGYAIAGDDGNNELYITKYNSSWAVQWTKNIVIPSKVVSMDITKETTRTLIQTSDGGYAIAGETNNNGDYDVFVAKLASTGTLDWTQIISAGTSSDVSSAIIQTSDGGYAIAGSTLSIGAGGWEPYIIKLTSTGALSWTSTYGSSGGEDIYNIIETSSGSLVVVGGNSFHVAKFSSTGVLTWAQKVAANGNFTGIVNTATNGNVIAGNTTSYGAGGQDAYVLELDINGTVLWSRTVGGTGTEIINSLITTSDGGYVVAGKTDSYGAGGYDIYVFKLNSSGALQWTKTLGATGVVNDQAYNIIQTSDGGYALTSGSGGADQPIIKLDSNGDASCCSMSSGGSSGSGSSVSSFSGTASSGGSTNSTGSVITGTNVTTAVCFP